MCDGEENPAAVPTPVPDIHGDDCWMSMHNHFVSSSKDKEPEVLFIGDSQVQLLHQLEIIVLWVGTYNHGHTAEQIAGGIQAIIRCLEKRQPQAKVIVLGLLPRGKNPNPLRERNKRLNELLVELMPSMPSAMFLDVDPGFVHSDGTISHHDMFDYLHLSRLGYSRVCQTLHQTLLQLLEGRGTTIQQ
ncbi:platelet-activating factor acetylhydrolase IB subunit alpha1 isoform X2 [Pseudophryne corroboree]|uniref:platelet-activating factor acetylhydrolase IB subunit alpha1 isoform X2 n=1 Tax=Pseudophryne corroboree TaxID=495146 RepID=UPI003081E9EF